MVKITLSKNNVLHLAELANLKLSEKELTDYQNQLQDTLKYIENLQELNTENTVPTNHAVNLNNVFFEDGEKNNRGLTSSEAVANTKNKKNNYFIVNRIL